MQSSALHEFHQTLNAQFGELSSTEIVMDYGDVLAEHAALRQSVGVLDFGFRSRICLTGADRTRFLHGQVTNDINRLRPGQGCYAALVTAKGKMQSDLNVFCLEDELLLDFEPGLTASVSRRLEQFIVADDVQVVNVAELYGLLSVQGPKAEAVVKALAIFPEIPANEFDSVKVADAMLGDIYLMNQPRLFRNRGESPLELISRNSGLDGASPHQAMGLDLFVPAASLGAVADRLIAAAKQLGGRACGWQAFEIARVEAGIPRFGADMDESNIPLECGIESRAISYSKGCYIGQEVINRIHSIGHVNKQLRGLRLADELPRLPIKGDKLFRDSKEVGYVTSAVKSPLHNGNVALGYVRREVNAVGTELILRSEAGETCAKIVELPFVY